MMDTVCLNVVGFRDVLWSLVCILCSLVSKEQGITVVAVCVVYDIFIANQVGGNRYWYFRNIII